MNEYILLLLGFILVRDYIQWRRDMERQRKLVEDIGEIFGGGVVVSASPPVPSGGGGAQNQISQEEENEVDIQDLGAFDLPEEYQIKVEENPPQAGTVRGEK